MVTLVTMVTALIVLDIDDKEQKLLMFEFCLTVFFPFLQYLQDKIKDSRCVVVLGNGGIAIELV